MPGYEIERRDPARIAGAVIRYQTDSPTFWIPIGIALVIGAVIGLVAGGTYDLIVGVLAAVLLCAVIVSFQRRSLAERLRRTAYRPGSRMDVEFGDDAFTLLTAAGAVSYPYDRIHHCRSVRGVLVVRLLGARSVVAIPGELVPDDRLPLLERRDAA